MYDLAIDFVVPIRKRFTGATLASRRMWVKLITGVTATTSVGADYGVVYAKVI